MDSALRTMLVPSGRDGVNVAFGRAEGTVFHAVTGATVVGIEHGLSLQEGASELRSLSATPRMERPWE